MNYICSHIFDRILGIGFELCTDVHYFFAFKGYKLNYSNVFFEDILSIYPHNLLLETDICLQDINFELYENTPICFLNQSSSSALSFDVFAACFFFLSRYEEYLPHTKDDHQRYDVVNSLAYKHDFLHLAVVDRWIKMLADKLEEKYSDISFAKRKFSFIPTFMA